MFRREWLHDPEFREWISGVPGEDLAYCKVCNSDFICKSKSNLRSHANGIKHNRLIREHRKSERQTQRASYPGNQTSRNRNRSRERSSVSMYYYASSSQIRERSPISVASLSRRIPSYQPNLMQRRQTENEVMMVQRNLAQRKEDFDFSESCQYLTYNDYESD